MSAEKLIIEVRYDFDDPSKNKLMEDAARMQAKFLLTTAMLLMDKRKPQVRLMGGNLFEGEAEISMAEDIEPDSIATDDTPEGRKHNG